MHIKSESKDEIRKIFYRLNLTNYSLNDQEKRHSNTDGKFVSLTKEISKLTFWDDNELFNGGDVKRMKDEEFCSTLILLARKGIINQTSQKPLNDAYVDYAENYPEYEEDKKRILTWIEKFDNFYTPENRSFVRKRTQLYTVFCLLNYLTEENIEIDKKIITRFSKFVKEYNKFENTSSTVESASAIEEAIKKYKLASSEGVNKVKNRVVRFEILRDYVLDREPKV
ncbi:MAG: hypothetical protein LUH15_00535 [Tannerellaceae bacterium]|nr:hypothetical protein [Tannerellaceae bacterium]